MQMEATMVTELSQSKIHNDVLPDLWQLIYRGKQHVIIYVMCYIYFNMLFTAFVLLKNSIFFTLAIF